MTFPLLVLYHLGVYHESTTEGITGQHSVVWALQWLFTFGGMMPWWWGAILAAILCVSFAWNDQAKHGVFRKMSASEFFVIIAESIFLALALALVMGFVVVPKIGHWPLFFDINVVLKGTFLQHWTIYAKDIGSAFYETLAFQVLILVVGGFLLKKILPGAYIVPLVVASTYAFAVMHFFPDVSPDRPLTTENVAVAVIMGFYFAIVYVHRGFAVAAWTHALHNAMFTTLFLKIIA